jgi:hypothetical protein
MPARCRSGIEGAWMLPPRLLAAATAAAALLTACAGPTFSQLLGERYFVTTLDTYPLLISSVDGQSSTLSVQYVEPGMRRLVLQGPPGASGVSVLRVFELQVKPCTRYYIVAVKASPLDSEFTPRVDFEQALAGCRP